MLKLNQRGYLNPLLIPFILAIVFFLGTAGFSIWAYNSRQEFKNNTDDKIATAVEKAVLANSAKKDAEFLDREKKPYREYIGPEAYGKISLNYPKTWSAYIDERGGNSATNIDNYYHPGVVQTTQTESYYALHIKVVSDSYDAELRQFESLIKKGDVKATPFRLEKVPSVLGTRIDGKFTNKKSGSLVLIPLRDKTILISTESPEYVKDFDSIILPSFKFSP